MKITNLITAAAVATTAMFAACGAKAAKNGKETDMEKNSKALVAYYSATGTTKAAAEQVAKGAGGELYEITPSEAYSAADLDWTVKTSRCCRENDDLKSRPAFNKTKDNLDGYDTVFLGFPNWWNGAPHVVNTFVEAYGGLKGKRVILFMTSGGSGISNSERTFKSLYPEAEWRPGKLLNGMSDKAIADWAKDCLAE